MKKSSILAKLIYIATCVSFAIGQTGPASDARSNFELALKAARDLDYLQAIEHLQQAVARDSTFIEAYLTLADVFNYSNSLAEGKAYFQQAIDQHPEHPGPYVALARLSLHSGDREQAFEFSRRAFKQGSLSKETLWLLVESALVLKKTRALAATLRKFRKSPSQKHLYELGYALWRLRINKFKKAKATILRYLEQQSQDPYGHKLLGDISRNLDEFASSNRAYRKALTLIAPSAKNFQATLYSNLGANFFEINQPDSGSFYFEQALRVADEIGARQKQVETRLALSAYYAQRRELRAFIRVCKEGVHLLAGSNFDADLLAFYLNLADVYDTLKARARALTYYKLAHEQAVALEDRAQQAGINLAIGQQYAALRQFGPAISYLETSYGQAQDIHDEGLAHRALLAMAEVYDFKGDVEQAKKAYETVLRFAQHKQENHLTERCLLKLANMYLTQSQDFGSATYYLTRADALARQTFQLQFAANHRWMQGNIALAENKIEVAETSFLQAIQLGRETGSYLSFLAGQAGLIKTYLQTDFADLAAAHADTALNYLDEFYSLCISEFTFEFFDLKNDLIVPAINAYASVGHLARLFETTETYKAVTHQINTNEVVLLTNDVRIDSIKDVTETTRRTIENKWRMLWDEWKQDQRDDLELVMRTKHEIKELHRRQQAFLARVMREYPELYDLFKPPVKTLSETQAALASLNGTLLHYLVSEQATFIVVVRPAGVYCKRVNINRSSLETYVREVNPMFRKTVERYDDINDAELTEFGLDRAAHLYKLLVEPVRPWLPEGGTLIISADDALNRLPLEILVTNPEDLIDNHDYAQARYLVEDFPILYVPFSTFLKTEAGERARVPGKLLAFVTPSGPSKQDAASNDAANGRTQTAAESEAPVEIKTVARVFSRKQSKILTHERATKANFLTESPHYQILHLSVPTVLNDATPLYSRMTFSDESESDLEVYDLFTLKLGAELAVLSGCERKIAGPGSGGMALNGMLHGFMFAGVPSLLTSFWRVPPPQEARVLSEFYANLRLGRNKAEALQTAKLSYLRNENRNPYFWAGVVLYGNPAAMQLNSNATYLVVYVTIVGLLMLAVVFARQMVKSVKKRRAMAQS